MSGASNDERSTVSSTSRSCCACKQSSSSTEAASALAGLAREEYVRTQPGPFAARIASVDLVDFRLGVTSTRGSTVYRCDPEPGIDVIALPTAWRGDSRWNGELIRRPALLRYSGPFVRTGTDVCTIEIGFARRPIEVAAAARAGAARAQMSIPRGPVLSRPSTRC